MTTETESNQLILDQNHTSDSEYLDIHQLINAKDSSYQKEFPSVYHHIDLILDDQEKLFHIRSIIGDSHHWQHDLAFWCLIDSCDKEMTPLDIFQLRNELTKIPFISNDYNNIDIIERLIFLQSLNSYCRCLVHLIELCIYLQTGHEAINCLFTLCRCQSMSSEDFLNILKALWMKKFLAKLINNHGTEVVTKNFHHKNHFLQCNIQLMQLFIISIPEPYESAELVKLFDYFTHEKNVLSLKDLESYVIKNTGKTLDICLNQLCTSICIQYIHKPIYISPKILSNLSYCIETMLSSWELEYICQLISIAQNNEDILHLNSILTNIVEFGLIFERTIFDFTRCSLTTSELSRIVHSYAIQVTLSREIKTFELKDLIDEIINQTYTQIDTEDKARKKQELSRQYNRLSVAFNQFSSTNANVLMHQLKSIRNFNFYSRIAFVIRVSDVIFKTPMRSVQKLAILLALNPSNTSARILQIGTGEGKTRIISVLAVIIVLGGVKVDVITSSKELAEIQVEELKGFYKFFNLKVACNAVLSSENYIYGHMRKKGNLPSQIFAKLGVFQPIYECDIIYGAADDFEGDILRDEFDETGLRCNRRCEFALIDEADNLMIDGRKQILHLASPVPSVFYLLPIKAAIWKLILDFAQIVENIDGKWYKLSEDDNENIVPQPLDKSIMDFAEEVLLSVVKRSVHLENAAPDRSTNKIIIPKHLHRMASKSLSIWIRNAVRAKFEMKEDFDYVLKDNKIVYVNTTTGLLHDTMRWNNGLHFFLEMKHGCSIQSEQITTNFISHVTFFRRYSKNLIGFTGTIGGASSQHLFNQVYSANCIMIPPFRERRHHELRPYFAKNTEEWFGYITYSAEEKMRQNRAILIITKYIKEAQTIANLLRLNFPNNVKLYSESVERNAVRETLEAGYAIVATNIAGRGTDILVSDTVEQNGGLHICITFLPDNDRVEQQNQGRTSRCGHQGTSQFIIDTSNESDYEQQLWLDEKADLQEIRHYRDTIQEIMTEDAIDAINETVKQDQIFQKFITLQKIIVQDFPLYVHDIAKDALREKYGRWIIETSSKANPTLQQSFDHFINICQQDPKNTLIDNPVYYIHMANRLLTKKEKIHEAINYLDKAIQMDPHCSAGAFYSLAYAQVLQYKRTGDICRLKDSISNFEEARRIIREILDPGIILFPVATTNSPLHEYLVHVKNLYGILLNSIDSAIGRPIDEYIKKIEEALENNEINDEQRKQLEKNLNYFKSNRDQIENGVLGNILKSKFELKIERKTLMESLPSDENKDLYMKEIDEFERNGFIGIIIFNERKPIEWWSVISVGLIGLAQIISGISLAVFSVGAGITLGISLLQEGISDLITCVKDGIINRNFSWIEWGIQKAVSLAVSIFSKGISALKSAARTFKSAAMTVKNAVNCGMKELWTRTLQKGIQIGGKRLALESIKRVGIELSVALTDYSLSAAVLPVIQRRVKTIIAEAIQSKFKNNGNLHLLMICDGKQRNRYYANQLKNKIFSRLNEKNFMNMCLSVVTTVFRSGSTYSSFKGIKVTAAMLDKLAPLTKEIYCMLNSISEHINLLVKSPEVQVILNQTKQLPHRINGLNYRISNMKQAEIESIAYTVEEFCSDITDQISKMICEHSQGIIVRDMISLGVDQVLSGYTKDINGQLLLFQKRRTVLDHQVFHISNIEDNINKETLAVADAEINHVRYGGLGGIHHIGYLSQATNRRIVIYNDQGRAEHVIGCDTLQPAIEIMFHSPNESNTTGYWTIVDEDNNKRNTTYKCLFDIIGEQTGLDISHIRQETVQSMKDNRSKLAAAMYDLRFLRQNHRDRLFFNEDYSSPR